MSKQGRSYRRGVGYFGLNGEVVSECGGGVRDIEELGEIFEGVRELGREVFVLFAGDELGVEFAEVLLESEVIEGLWLAERGGAYPCGTACRP